MASPYATIAKFTLATLIEAVILSVYGTLSISVTLSVFVTLRVSVILSAAKNLFPATETLRSE